MNERDDGKRHHPPTLDADERDYVMSQLADMRAEIDLVRGNAQVTQEQIESIDERLGAMQAYMNRQHQLHDADKRLLLRRAEGQ